MSRREISTGFFQRKSKNYEALYRKLILLNNHRNNFGNNILKCRAKLSFVEILLRGMSYFKERGVALYLVLVIMGILLAAVLGLSAALIGQIKTIKGIGHSVKALYAADTGIERALGDDIPLASYGPTWINEAYNGAYYEVWVNCCEDEDPTCYLEPNECESYYGLSEDPNCKGYYFCYESIGTYEETKRAIEITR